MPEPALVNHLPTADGVVTVTFDELDRPTIRAGTPHAAAFGLGWACARHRRAQLDLLRRASQGRLAEVLGADAVPGDVRQRTLGLAGVAERCWTALPADQRRMLEFHAAGVNAVPAAGVEPWRPVDAIAVAQGLFQSLTSDGTDNRMVEVLRRSLPAEVVDFLLDPSDEFGVELDGSAPDSRPAPMPLVQLRRLMAQPATTGQARIVVADGPPCGSNAWVVARDGAVVLANDMHLELTTPSLLYAVRLVLPDTEVAGVTVPGLPTLVAGTNGTVAWGFTRLPGDVCLLREVRPGTRPDTYLVGDRAEPYGRRRERIRVRGGADVVVDVRETRWGPVTTRLRDCPIAFASPLTDPGALDFGLAGLYAVRDVHRAADVINECGLPPLNALLADASGSLMWTVGGRYPARVERGPRGFASGSAVPRLPARSLPRLAAAAGGFLVNCNNGNHAIRAAGLAWNLFSGCRARRAAEALAAGHASDVGGSADLQLDLDAAFYLFYRDLALRHLDAVRPHDSLAPLRAEVAAWHGTAARDEIGLALLVTFRELVREELFAAVTRPCQRYDPRFTYCYHGHERPLRRMLGALGDGLVPVAWRTPERFVIGQLATARAWLTRRTGTAEPVRWGAVNRLAGTPAAGMELSGCPESLRVTQPDFGAAMRLVLDLARPGEGVLSLPGSPAGDPAADRNRLVGWAEGRADGLPGVTPVRADSVPTWRCS